jgi:small subunit ribosomal protein S9
MEKVKKTKVTKTPAKVQAPAKLGVPLSHGVGRRKSSVARVYLRKGTGKIIVNDKEFSTYFTTDIARLDAVKPFNALKLDHYDAHADVQGGGINGQAGALCLGISRALVSLDESMRRELRSFGLLTVDSRVKERKKPGQKAARRKFQFVKR